MTQLRKLAPEEFPSLCQIGDGFMPDARQAIAIVAEDAGETVGRVFLMCPVHVEGPWIREDKRGGLLASRLIKVAEHEAKEAGVEKLLAFGASAELEDYLQRLGFTREPLSVWSKEL